MFNNILTANRLYTISDHLSVGQIHLEHFDLAFSFEVLKSMIESHMREGDWREYLREKLNCLRENPAINNLQECPASVFAGNYEYNNYLIN